MANMWTANECTWKDKFEVADIERPGQTMSNIHLLHFADFWDLHRSRALQTQKYIDKENQKLNREMLLNFFNYFKLLFIILVDLHYF